MRKFIVSDLHGNGNVYKSIMFYLENISKNEDVILYINGDLIDRGIESGNMLLDVKKRMINNPFKIVYLGGNHELMMYQTFVDRMRGLNTSNIVWYYNGGGITDSYLEAELETKEEDIELTDFIGNLKLVHIFDEKIDNKNIMLVHAACPSTIDNIESVKIKNNDGLVHFMVWTRGRDLWPFINTKLTNQNFFSIIGHTPNKDKYGFEYHKDSNYLNIDGGSARYVMGNFSSDHVPLVEIKDGYLKILTFNNDNDIVYGNYFSDSSFTSFSNEELEKEKCNLNTSFKPKKLKKLNDGIIGYSDWE